jgi:roadblock/LC7 domain-containing protein
MKSTILAAAVAAALLLANTVPAGARAPQQKGAKRASGAAASKKVTERDVFLTPGGLYTKADIKANGNKTVSQKYPDFMAAHDAMPKPGERLCPISKTKANPKLTWIVGGKKYTFCCPPCVTEFVKQAKTNPKSIQAPEAYVKSS